MSAPTLADIEAMPVAQRLALLRAASPRIPEPFIPHAPHPPQAMFLLDQRKEAFYGGAAGGGKSDALLMSALQYVDVPRYSALIIRRTWNDLSLPGAIMERADLWLRDTAARPRDGGRYWTFPSKARLQFGYVQYPRDVSQYKSAEFQTIGFDELTQFAESSYRFMFSRLRRPAIGCEGCDVKVEKIAPGEMSRSARGRVGAEVADVDGWVHMVGQVNYHLRCARPLPNRRALAEYPPSKKDGLTLFDVPLRMRGASNPGDLGHAWVRDRFVDPERRLKTASFYPARLLDNPSLDQESYEDSLNHLAPTERARLLAGDWDIADEGTTFHRDWFAPIDRDSLPAGRKRLRYWDFAATKVRATGDRGDPDWTTGALVALHEGVWYIEDIVRLRETPHRVERAVANTAAQDGREVPVRMEQEPGSSGVMAVDHYRRNVLVGYDFDRYRPTTTKEERARPWASAAEAGNVRMVGAAWNRDLLDEVSAFPYGAHDDQVDAISGAVEMLVRPKGRLIV